MKVVIAGAGGAAHLPGMTASMTRLPVLGVPIESQALKGMDSLLSIVQMPAGVPVGTLAIGKPGAINAALLAAAMLATDDESARPPAGRVARGANRIGRRSARMIPPGSTIGIIGGGQLGRMLAVAAAQLGYKCHVFDPHEHPPAADVAARLTRAEFDDVGALRELAGIVDVATYEFENLPVGAARRARRQALPLDPLARHRPGPRAREGLHRRDRGSGRAVAHGCVARGDRGGRA